LASPAAGHFEASEIIAPARGSSMLAVNGNIKHDTAVHTEEALFRATARRSGLLKAFMDEVRTVIDRESMEPNAEASADANVQLNEEVGAENNAEADMQLSGEANAEGVMAGSARPRLEGATNGILEEAKQAYADMDDKCKLAAPKPEAEADQVSGEADATPSNSVSSADIVTQLEACTQSLTNVGFKVQALNKESSEKNENFATHFAAVQTALKKFKNLKELIDAFDKDHQAALTDLTDRAGALRTDVAKINSTEK